MRTGQVGAHGVLLRSVEENPWIHALAAIETAPGPPATSVQQFPHREPMTASAGHGWVYAFWRTM